MNEAKIDLSSLKIFRDPNQAFKKIARQMQKAVLIPDLERFKKIIQKTSQKL